jgi:hypothetical protein
MIIPKKSKSPVLRVVDRGGRLGHFRNMAMHIL